MGLMTFKGGVHPFEGKDLSKDKPIRELLPKGELVYPLSQHIGAPATPIVAVGDSVLKGQKIAEAGGFVSAPIHASVSGTVKKIEPRRVPTGDMVNSIVIESDGEFKEVEYQAVEDVSALSKEEIINRIKEAGVVGMGGAGFPTHVKLSPKEPEKIDYIIANCAECEPYLTSDYRIMLDHTEELVEGMRIILSMFEHAKGVFAVENNKPDCIAKLLELTKDEPRMEVAPLMTKYPQGFQELLDAAGGFKEQPEKIISGGPMMGFSMFGLDVPTTKTTSALLCMTKDEVAEADADATACINCGRCVEACPEQIVPSRLSKFSEHGDMAGFEKWHGLECVECGSCSFICPAKRPLAQLIKTMKKQVLAEKKKNK